MANETALVLCTGEIVKKSCLGEISQIKYFNNGAVRSFFYKGNEYRIASNNGDINAGKPFYILLNKFIELNSIEQIKRRKLKGISKSGKATRAELIPYEFLNYNNLKLVPATTGDKVQIIVRKLKVLQGGDLFPYSGPIEWVYIDEAFSSFNDIYPPTLAYIPNMDEYEIIDPEYYDYINILGNKKVFNSISGKYEIIDINKVANVAQALTRIKRDIPDFYQVLEESGMLPVLEEQERIFSIVDEGDNYSNYTNDDYEEYSDFLVYYEVWLRENISELMKMSTRHKTYAMVHLFNEKELTILDASKKIDILDFFADKSIDEAFWFTNKSYRRELEFLKIVKSVTEEQADLFLDKLLYNSPSDKSKTRFEVYYRKLDDNRAKNYPSVYSSAYSNCRSKFIKELTRIWKTSKYNPNYAKDPNDLNDEGVNLNSYFIDPNKGLNYFYRIDENDNPISPPLLEFKNTKTNEEYIDFFGFSAFKWIDIQSYYEAEKDLHGKEIHIIADERIQEIYHTEDNIAGNDGAPPGGTKILQDTSRTLKYHIFQPISIIGYTPHHDISVSVDPVIPAFVFYYYEDYERLAHLDALINLGIELAFEVLLFPLFGTAAPIAAIRHLRYIKYLTKAGRIAKGLDTTTVAVNVWRGVQGLTDSIAFTSANISSYYSYLAQTTNNTEDIEKYRSQRSVFAMLSLGFGLTSMGSGLILKNKVTNAVAEINNYIDNNISYTINADFNQSLLDIAGDDGYILSIRNKIQNYAPGALQNFDQLSTLKKVEFFDDFNLLNDANIWSLFDINPSYITLWKDLRVLNIPERKAVNLFDNTNLMTSYQRFYNEEELPIQLDALHSQSRINFIETFGDADNSFLNSIKKHPDYIEYWGKADGNFKTLAKNNPNDSFGEFYAIKRDKIATERYNNPNWNDTDTGQKLRKSEHEQLFDFENQCELEVENKGANQTGDAKIKTLTANSPSGFQVGMSVDVAGIPKRALNENRWKVFPVESLEKHLESIDNHFFKMISSADDKLLLDIFVLDLRNYDVVLSNGVNLKQAVLNHINSPIYPYSVLRSNSNKFVILNQ